MRIFFILIFLISCNSCTANSESLTSHYSSYVGGDFILTESMALYEQSKGNYSSYDVSLVRQSDCCHQGTFLVNLPKNTKVTIKDILRYTLFTNDCNEAVGKVDFNGKTIEFEFFINCNYQGFKVAKSLPWKAIIKEE